MHRISHSCTIGLCLLVFIAGGNAQSAAPNQAPVSPASTPVASQGKPMDDLKAFVGNNRLLDAKADDIDGDGKPDALLVLDPPTNGSGKLGEGPSRTVLLLTRNASGQLEKAAQNDKLVPCTQCGGIAGDPYSYTQMGKGQFTVVTEGGSREHWSNEYSFAYAQAQGAWLLHEVKREVTDQETGKHKVLDLTPKDFGTVRFQDFDPTTLPEVTLP
jgi:hypothetical protein